MSRLHQISGCANHEREADIVFVHGLGGDPFSTWRHGDSDLTSWPHWIGKEFPNVGVWSLGYAASPTKWARLLRFVGLGDRDSGYSMALPDRASQVVDLMILKGLGDRPILFICHSLGGLVVKQIIRKSADSSDARKLHIADKTRAVLFLATPHTGATLASIAHSFRAVFGSTVSLEDLRAHDAHLRDLYDWYRNQSHKRGIRTVTYFESRGVKGVLPIVNPSSAHPGVGEDPVALDEDHLSIAKPSDSDAQVYGAARDLLRNHLRGTPTNPAGKPPSAPQQVLTQEVVVKLEAGTFARGAPVRIPREIPPAAHMFFGREAECKRVAERIRAGLNTAVTGPAGFGKTALAARAITDVVGEGAANLQTSYFSEGLIYLDLYTFHGHAEPAWNALANRLNSPEFMELRGARERATEACRGRRILVIIEGGEEADGSFGRTSIPELFSVFSPENRWLLLTRVSNQSAAAETVRIQEALKPAEAEQLLDWLIRDRPLSEPVRKAILGLLEGHPLALNWAGNLLALGEEDPEKLAFDWRRQGLKGLTDPRQAEHTLHWLFARSVRGLGTLERQALLAGGLCAHAPFSFEMISTALDHVKSESDVVRSALRALVQRGLLRRIGDGYWQFSHVLGYRFARSEDDAEPELLERLSQWFAERIRAASASSDNREIAVSVGRQLEHSASLLRADSNQRLWNSLAKPLLYETTSHFEKVGRLELVHGALEAVAVWLSRLPDKKAEEPLWLAPQFILLVKQGDVLRDQGDLTGALRVYRRSLLTNQLLVDADPLNVKLQRDLSLVQDRVGDVLRTQGDMVGALDAFRKALEIIQRLANTDPSHQTLQRDLSISQGKIGDTLLAQGDLIGALRAYEESLAIRKRLSDSDPSNPTWQRDITTSRERIGHVLQSQGDLAKAFTAYEEALAIRLRLLEADRSNANLQRDISITRNKIGDILRAQGDVGGALVAYNESLATRMRLAESDPSNARWQQDLSTAHTRVGATLQEQGDLEGAQEAFNSALVISQRLAEADPSNARWAKELSVCHAKLGELFQMEGNLAEAMEMLNKSLEARQCLAESDPLNVEWQRDLSAIQNRIGDVLMRSGDLPGGLRAFNKSLAVSRRLVDTDPSNAEWLRALSLCLTDLAVCHSAQGSLAEALRAAEESHRIDQRLVALDPSNAIWRRDLEISSGLAAELSARQLASET